MFTVEYKTRKSRRAVIVDPPEVVSATETKEIAFAHQFLDGLTQQQITNCRLSAAVAGVIDALFRPLAVQIERGIGDLDRRKKVRDLIRKTFNGMSARRDDEVTVAFWPSRNSPRIIITHGDQWWVDLKPTLRWEGRNGVSLVGVDCHTTFHVPGADCAVCAAWFERQRDRLDAHFAKRLATPAAIQGEVQ
ncbi:hypothetical protein [Brevundimonas goettingensis]|uniref:Uncharacterized protein n=1 Tax=Brevundimonas goettingensis TaxID=2774190 RepID=A0A975C0X2_9CAUL|nr:hypothetical protein [Brevundimonas goettingensis]QTC90857.1 hypothetical protein IFJ75_16765 [Brevundimonas goettingensis]